MTPREPDRFDAQARELLRAIRYQPNEGDIPRVAAELRAAESSVLKRAAQEIDRLRRGLMNIHDAKAYFDCTRGAAWDYAQKHARSVLDAPSLALIPPAAAPAADYDPITAPIPAGDMNGPHGPLPAAETPYKVDRFDCHECGVDVRVDEDHCCASCGRDAIEVVDGQPVGPLCGVYAPPPAETGKAQGAGARDAEWVAAINRFWQFCSCDWSGTPTLLEGVSGGCAYCKPLRDLLAARAAPPSP